VSSQTFGNDMAGLQAVRVIRSPSSAALLVLGSNLGDRLGYLRQGVAAVGKAGEICAVSPVYESAAAEFLDQGPFLNVGLRLMTSLGPLQLLMWCKSIEFAAGRRPGIPYGPRSLDMDIASLGKQVLQSTRISIPHPRLTERPFMIAPLADIAGSETLPGHASSLTEIDRKLGRTDLLVVAQATEVWPNA
jgi:2-amino-4-hydroxy-6-hydroxymethyldihydropteridine diphosphokinase